MLGHRDRVPELSAIGKGGRGAQGFADYVAQPSKFGNNVMPAFADIGADNLAALGSSERLQGSEEVATGRGRASR